MTIQRDDELQALRVVGRLVAGVLQAMEDAVCVGITSAELDAIAARLLEARGARSAPRLVYGFPGTTCISVNDEVVHGVPTTRALRRGDVVKLDVTAELDGFMADAARTVLVGPPSEVGARLASCATAAFERGLVQARAGRRVALIGRAVEAEVRRRGCTVLRELCGHGIGKTIHEPPTVPNYYAPRSTARLQKGAVITIEPLISAGSDALFVDRDGWTIRTQDRALSAHHEHTLVVTEGRPILLTAA